MKQCNHLLYKKVFNKNFCPVHVAEVGVWHPETSNVFSYIEQGVRTTLVEPDPDSARLIHQCFGHMDHVTLHQCALCDYNGSVELCQRGSSTFVAELPKSPAIVNDGCDVYRARRFKARAMMFSEIDDGTIDLISIDTEGSEWFVLKHMKSRPAVVSVETHGGMYLNPYIEHIYQWFTANAYMLWYRDKSDSVFVKCGCIRVTAADRAALGMETILLYLHKKRKHLSRSVKALTRRKKKEAVTVPEAARAYRLRIQENKNAAL